MRTKRSMWVAGGVAIAVAASGMALALSAIGATVPSRLTMWSTQFGTSVVDKGAAVIVAPNGYVYVYGQTEGAITGTHGTDSDVFLACYDRYGTRQWVQQFGTAGTETPGNQIGVAGNGDVYITGTTDGEFPGDFHEGGQDVFIAKFNRKGSLRWVKQYGGTGDDQGWGITRAQSGHLYVAVETTSTDFVSGALPDNVAAGKMDSVLMKLDHNGELGWAKQFGSAEDDWAWSVHTSRKGEIYVAGTTFGDLDGAGAQVFHGSDSTKGDGFLVRFDNRGRQVWVRQVGDTDDDQMYGVATDTLGDVYLSGFTYGSLGNNDGFSGNLGGADGVLMKFSKDGIPRWVHQHGTSGDDLEWSITVNKLNRIVVGGYTSGAFAGYTNLGGTDAYVMRFTQTGTGTAVRQFGTPGNEGTNTYGVPVAFAPNGTVVLVGTTDSATWGQQNYGLTDVFATVIPAP